MNKLRTFSLALFLALLLGSCLGVFAQTHSNSKADSLRQTLGQKSGIDKIETQLDLALLILESNNKEAKLLAQDALAAAQKSDNKVLEIRAYFVLGRAYRAFDTVNESQAYYDTALQISDAVGENWYKSEVLLRTGINKHTQGSHYESLEAFSAAIRAGRLSENYRIIGASYSMMGTIYRVNGMYDRAIEYIIQAKINYEKINYLEGYAWSAYLLGRIYGDLKNHDKALENYEDALEMYRKIHTTDGTNSGLAICYEQIGLLHLRAGNIEQARKDIKHTLQLNIEDGSKYGISNARKNLGRIEYVAKNYTLAEQYLQEALTEKIALGDALSQPGIYLYLGLCAIATGQDTEGLASINKGLDIAVKNNQKTIQMDIYAKLSGIYSARNELGKALDCKQKENEIQAIMLSGGASIKIEQLQGIYEVEAKNSRIAELQRENELNALLIKQHRQSILLMILGVVVAFLVSGISIWFYRRIKQKNKQLQEANAAKDKFFAIIAHDLRGPTNSLTSFLELLNNQFEEFSREKLKEILEMLYKSSENVSMLLENLLIWARSQVNKMEYRPEKLKLDELLRNSLESLQQLAAQKQITINYNTDSSLYVFADSNMLQTAVRNIISNAIKFTPRLGAIIIQSETGKHNTALIRFSDNGIGIDKTSLSKIFDIDNLHHTKGTENEKSSGLGLLMVKDFVEKNKGTVSIESEKGKGTTISICLPLG